MAHGCRLGDESPEALERWVAGHGGHPAIGDPDDVAPALARMQAAGFAGVAQGFVNHLNEPPFFLAEVLPRLERLGVRIPVED
jgi:FMNH2-dependent dimethyl sulfone monooxygenase